MKNSLHFRDGAFDEYTLTVDDEQVALNCYLSGSLTGGAGTECWHTIKGSELLFFLQEVGAGATSELPALIEGFAAEDWRRIHQVFEENQTEGHTWSDTNWD